jgi:hypothetical protein
MSNLTGQAGELRMSIEVTRKDTGKVEKYELIGFTDEEQLKQHMADQAEQKED